MKKKFWTSDKVVSLAAILISLTTLYIFVKQTNIIEKQSRLSAMPYLMLETSNNGELSVFMVDVVNHGVGPAIVEKRVMRYMDKVYDVELIDFLRAQIPQMDTLNVINVSTLQPGLAIPAGGKRNVLTVGGNREDYLAFLAILAKIQEDGFGYEVEYKSIYEDRWIINSIEDTPEEIQ